MTEPRIKAARALAPVLHLVHCNSAPVTGSLRRFAASDVSEAMHPRLRQRQQELMVADCVSTLELLLRHARAGRISGIAWAALLPEGLHPHGDRMAADTAGEAATNAAAGRELTLCLFEKASAMARGERVKH